MHTPFDSSAGETEKRNERKGTGRKKLWQLDTSFHCGIIGTCLSLGELRILCQKMRIRLQSPVSDYELHRAFVDIAGRPGYAAQRLQRLLDNKFRLTIRHFAKAKDDAALATYWEEAVTAGEVAGAYWALVTHPSISAKLFNRVYGEVHMLSHLAGAAVRIDMQELNRLQRLTRTITKQLADVESQAKAQITERDITIGQLRAHLTQVQVASIQFDETRERLAVLESEPHTCRLQNQVEKYAAKLAAERARAERTEAIAEEWKRLAMESGDLYLRLERQQAELRAERDAMETVLEKLLAPECAACLTQEDGQIDRDLCGRCVLYVGGRERQCAHFRTLVERQNGRFMHHDGGLHDGRLRLGAILPQADAVFCPLDCISHDAVNRVKQFCKRHDKRLVLLPRSSLAAFARGLHEVAA